MLFKIRSKICSGMSPLNQTSPCKKHYQQLYILISFLPEKMSKAEEYSFRDCLDNDDLSALKARFEKALEMPEFSMFMEKMNACDFASAMLHTRSKFISMYD